MSNQKLLTITLLALAITCIKAGDFDCDKECMQCFRKFDRGYCTMCRGKKAREGHCEGETEGNCVAYEDYYDPRGRCVRCAEDYVLKINGNDRYCAKKSEEEHNKDCMVKYRWVGDNWRCTLCDGGVPDRYDSYGECRKFDDKEQYRHCAEGTNNGQGYVGCYRCEKGYALHYNSARPFDLTSCVKWTDDGHDGCLTWNSYQQWCDVCDVENGYYKKDSYERGCHKL